MARVSYLRLRRTLLQGRAPWLAFLGLVDTRAKKAEGEGGRAGGRVRAGEAWGQGEGGELPPVQASKHGVKRGYK